VILDTRSYLFTGEQDCTSWRFIAVLSSNDSLDCKVCSTRHAYATLLHLHEISLAGGTSSEEGALRCLQTRFTPTPQPATRSKQLHLTATVAYRYIHTSSLASPNRERYPSHKYIQHPANYRGSEYSLRISRVLACSSTQKAHHAHHDSKYDDHEHHAFLCGAEFKHVATKS
jgi:hypothetical protein